jgi:hypothetical protein
MLILLPYLGNSQHKDDFHPCGTKPFKTDFTIAYEKSPQAFKSFEDTLIYVPLTIHIVGTDDSSGFYQELFLHETLCQVNEDFAASNIYFYILGDIRYLSNSDYYQHEDVLEGADMMFANNVRNTINCYIVNDPAGNCGYNLPYAGIAMNTSCMGYGDHTFSHELGHALTVQHPFLGWEGNNYQSGSPAQDTLIYDYTYFRDTLIRDTVILDTTISELVDRSNCLEAADRHCDTPPDFISRRWSCDDNGRSPNVMYDSNNQPFYADGTLIMSYANDACQSRFTQEQSDQMRANLIFEKSEYLVPKEEPMVIENPVVALTPAEGENVPVNEIVLSWSAVEGVDKYAVVLGLGPFQSSARFYYTQDTFLIPEDYNFFTNAPYSYRVVPMSKDYFCAPESLRQFNTVEPTSNEEILSEENIRIWPRLLQRGKPLTIENKGSGNWKISVFNSNGLTVADEFINSGETRRTRALGHLTAGVYFVNFSNEERNMGTTLIVH